LNYSFIAEANGMKSNTLNISVFLEKQPMPAINENTPSSNKKILNSYT
jgi:hypothetical protein